MPRTSIPTPVAAVVGLVPAVLTGVLRLPGRALHLPARALSSTLTAASLARREYDDLAERGERLYARLRGQSISRLQDTVEAITDQGPFAGVYDVMAEPTDSQPAGYSEGYVDQISPELADRVGAPLDLRDPIGGPTPHNDEVTSNGRDAMHGGTDEVRLIVQSAAAFEGAGRQQTESGDTLTEVSDADEAQADDEAPKGAPTRKAPQNKASNGKPAARRTNTAATPEVVEVVEAVVEKVAARVVPGASAGDLSSAVLASEDLPLADYDHLTLGALRGRLRALDVVQLVHLHTYEKNHANRLPVVTMLDNRIAKLATTDASPESTSAPRRATDQPST